jgi:hypothetical protein
MQRRDFVLRDVSIHNYLMQKVLSDRHSECD